MSRCQDQLKEYITPAGRNGLQSTRSLWRSKNV